MAKELRTVKYIVIVVLTIIVFFVFGSWTENGLKNHSLPGRQLPVGWHTVKNTLGLCEGYMSEYTDFPFATSRTLPDERCGMEENGLAKWLNFLLPLGISLIVSVGTIQLLTLPFKNRITYDKTREA